MSILSDSIFLISDGIFLDIRHEKNICSGCKRVQGSPSKFTLVLIKCAARGLNRCSYLSPPAASLRGRLLYTPQPAGGGTAPLSRIKHHRGRRSSLLCARLQVASQNSGAASCGTGSQPGGGRHHSGTWTAALALKRASEKHTTEANSFLFVREARAERRGTSAGRRRRWHGER